MKKIIAFPDSPVRVAVSNVRYKATHYHPYALEMLFVLEGRVAITMNQQTYFVAEGEFIIINIGCLHTLHCDVTTTMVSLYFNLEHYSEQLPYIRDAQYLPTRAALTQNQLACWAEIRNYFIRLMLLHNKNTPSSQTVSGDLCKRIMRLTWQNLQDHRPMPDHALERFYSISAYLRSNYTQDISVAQVAEHEGISVTRLAHFWKEAAGCSIRQSITALRLGDAEKMLIETPYSVSEVAYQCGFSDEKYFYQHFKAHFKSTPNEYRVKYLESQRKTVRELLSRREGEYHIFLYAMKYYTAEIAPSIPDMTEEEQKTEQVLSQLYNTILTHPHELVEQLKSTGQTVSYLHITMNRALTRREGELCINWEYVYAQMHIFLERGLSNNVIIDYDLFPDDLWRPLLQEYVDELVRVWGKRVVESQEYHFHSMVVSNYTKCIALADYLCQNTAVRNTKIVYML